MKVATITEAKNGLSALIEHVRAGGSVLILDRGVPVARLESAVGPDAGDEERSSRLRRAGMLRPVHTAPTGIALTEPPAPRPGASAVAALLAERRGGR